MKIGVLALQGAFREHIGILSDLGVEAVEIRLPQELQGLDALIIPGGESTTIGKLAIKYELMAPLKEFSRDHAVWGTCAGMIFMAKDIGIDQPLLGIMDIVVERNAFGRQLESFVVDLPISAINNGLDQPFSAVFIRAPRLVSGVSASGVAILAELADGSAVAAEQGHWLVTSFHPELTGDNRLHAYFIEMAKEASAVLDSAS